MKFSHILFGATVAVAATAMPASAQNRSWDLGNFQSSVPTTGGCAFTTGTSTGNANAATCSPNALPGATLTVRAFGLNATNLVENSSLRSHGSFGVGGCNPNEISGCSSPNHAVDNIGSFTDFVLLQFSAPVALTSVTFGWTNGDADFSIFRWAGAPAVSSPTTGAGLSASWTKIGDYSGKTDGTANTFSGLTASTAWIVSAFNTPVIDNCRDRNTDWQGNSVIDNCRDDAFKIKTVAGTVVPEPSTYALMGAGLLGIFGAARRRRA